MSSCYLLVLPLPQMIDSSMFQSNNTLVGCYYTMPHFFVVPLVETDTQHIFFPTLAQDHIGQ